MELRSGTHNCVLRTHAYGCVLEKHTRWCVKGTVHVVVAHVCVSEKAFVGRDVELFE